MNIIYKNTDFSIPIHVVDNEGLIPIEDLEVLNIKVFTTDISTCITFDKTDLDASGNLHIDASTLADCQNGLVYYKYQAAYPDTAWEDGVYDVARIVQTDNYFKYHDNVPAHKTTCATAVSELVNDIHYATQDWVNSQIENAAEAGVDLTNYYTKSQIDEKFDDIDVSVDLTNYYTKSEVDQKIADISAGDVSIHVDLSDYYTKSEVNELIPDTSGFVTVTDLSTAIADVSVDLTNYYTKTEVNNLIPDTTGFITESALSDYATKTDISTFVTATDLSTAIADVSVDMSAYYTKSEVNNLIPDTTNFITAVDISTCVLSQAARYIWTGDASAYNALSSYDASTIYLIK